MNERIQALALQAGYLPDSFGVGHWDMPECKKFAELIVREVFAKIEDERFEIYQPVKDSVMKHFGIAE